MLNKLISCLFKQRESEYKKRALRYRLDYAMSQSLVRSSYSRDINASEVIERRE